MSVITAISDEEEIGFQAVSMQGARKLAELAEAIKELHDECDFMFTTKGIHINALDVNDAALTNLTLWADSFQRYFCKKNYVCRLNVEHFYKVFKACGRAQQSNRQTQVTISIKENSPEAVYFSMANPGSGLRAEVRLMAHGHQKEMMKIQNSRFDRYIQMPSTEFQSMISYISNFTSSGDDDNKELMIEMYDDNSIEFSSQGQFGDLRVIVHETNTGMAVIRGDVDALDEDMVRAPQDALANDNEGAEEETPSRKRRRAQTQTGEDAEDAAAGASTMQQPAVEAQTRERRLLVRSTYNLKYVKIFTKATPLSPQVRIFVRDQFPVLVTYSIGTMGVLHYALAQVSADENAPPPPQQEQSSNVRPSAAAALSPIQADDDQDEEDAMIEDDAEDDEQEASDE